MIGIIEKHNCCGCSACVQICPKQCISFNEDERGFRYPLVNKELCIDCHLCEKVCPSLNQKNPINPLRIYAAVNPSEKIRRESSSGGIFTMVAEDVIAQGGVVFGARFDDDWEVIHDYAETSDGLDAFRKSKYLQSQIKETYRQTSDFLKTGRKVLFTGTQCQVAGLKHYLGKEYDNLVTIEILCHGVPSPLVWRNYLEEAVYQKHLVGGDVKAKPEISGVSFRDKSDGWRDFALVVHGKTASKTDQKTEPKAFIAEHATKNKYMSAFLNNLILRPSCFQCPAKGCRSRADISIGDFWTINQYCPHFNDDKGVSIVYINSEKGVSVFQQINCEKIELDKGIRYNKMYYDSCDEKYPIDEFWAAYDNEGLACVAKIVKGLRPSYFERAINKIKRIVGF